MTTELGRFDRITILLFCAVAVSRSVSPSSSALRLIQIMDRYDSPPALDRRIFTRDLFQSTRRRAEQTHWLAGDGQSSTYSFTPCYGSSCSHLCRIKASVGFTHSPSSARSSLFTCMHLLRPLCFLLAAWSKKCQSLITVLSFGPRFVIQRHKNDQMNRSWVSRRHLQSRITIALKSKRGHI